MKRAAGGDSDADSYHALSDFPFLFLLFFFLLLFLLAVGEAVGSGVFFPTSFPASQASVTFFPVQGLENNVAYWTSIGVAEASRLPGAA